jgi:hypothetical protein
LRLNAEAGIPQLTAHQWLAQQSVAPKLSSPADGASPSAPRRSRTKSPPPLSSRSGKVTRRFFGTPALVNIR